MLLTKQDFIQLAIDHDVLRFGQFQLKSGRISPYFFNAGLFYQGQALQMLGRFYAQIILANQLSLKHLFGPAYKGLPLATAAAIALAEQNRACTVTFNRKEVKDHGEGGVLIGAPLTGETIIIDDVITAGTAFREAKTLIETHGGRLSAVVIALDRCEKGLSEKSAIAEIEANGVPVFSIMTVYDIVTYLQENNKVAMAEAIIEYLNCYS